MTNGVARQQMMGTTKNNDRTFLQMMILLHQAAIRIAEEALTHAQHPEIKQLVQTMMAAQRAEIVDLQTELGTPY